ncbi:tyrosyl-tRNA synthetase [Klebsiella michiganensis]|uniref:Tyrosyl-tRNA synthetase n=1 Tax=Klebsiella michiganensis TaxID=1134687 RepID=A0A7H4MXX9_9ENTR|nr:tyrosyl-tRNA synthetase [Klebsiella michiganensis]
MASSNLIKQLQERGLIAQVTDEEALAERLAQGPIALYCGFDPPLTACIWGILFHCYA